MKNNFLNSRIKNIIENAAADNCNAMKLMDAMKVTNIFKMNLLRIKKLKTSTKSGLTGFNMLTSIALTLIFFVLGISPVTAQVVRLSNVSLDEFPVLSASVFAADSSEINLSKLSKSDFTMVNNGFQSSLTSFECATAVQSDPATILLVLDCGQSMSATKLDFMKKIATAFARNLAYRRYECGLLSFNYDYSVESGFTADRLLLEKRINALKTTDGTNMTTMFDPTGKSLISLMVRAKYAKHVVIISDGSTPHNFNEAAYSLKANLQNVKFHFIELGSLLNEKMRKLAINTSGHFYDNIDCSDISKVNIAIGAALELEKYIFNEPLCKIKWLSKPNCAFIENIRLTCNPLKASFETSVLVPDSIHPQISYNVSNGHLRFGLVPSNTKSQKKIELTAKNGDVTVDSYLMSNAQFSVVDWGGSAPPFTILAGEKRTITVEFSPKDTLSISSELLLKSSNACFGNTIYCSGGIPYLKPTEKTLKIIFPNGGEKLLANKDTAIWWSGAVPSAPVFLDYSSDGGGSWNAITTKAVGNSYTWRVPSIDLSQCVLRAKLMSASDQNDTSLVLAPHNDAVTSLAWNPNGMQIVTVSADSTIRIWDAPSASLYAVLDRTVAAATSVAWSADGKFIAAGTSIGTVNSWNAATGLPANSFNGLSGRVMSVAFSPDSKLLAGSDANGNILIWHAETGILASTILKQSKSVNSIAFSPDGTMLATGSDDLAIKLWKTSDGSYIRTMNHTGKVSSIAFAPDSKRIVAGSSANDAIVFNTDDGSLIKTIPGLWISAVAWSPDGLKIATGQMNDSIYIYNGNDYSLENRLPKAHSEYITTVAWRPFGPELASASGDSTARYWILNSIPYEVQEDVSDAPWSIVKPTITGKTVDIGIVSVGIARDTIVTSYLTNNSAYDIKISDMSVEGAMANDFNILSPAPPFTLPANGSTTVELSFTPSASGIRNANVYLYTEDEKINAVAQYAVSGTGAQYPFGQKHEDVDFKMRALYSNSDTLIVMLHNSSAEDVEITGTELLGTLSDQYAIMQGGGSFTISPNGDHQIGLRFNPTVNGFSSAILRFSLPTPIGSATIYRVEFKISGEAFAPTGNASIVAGDITAKVGDLFDLPVYVQNPQLFSESGTTALEVYLRVPSNAIYPNGSTPLGRIFGTDRVIPLRLEKDSVQSGKPQIFRFRALLSEQESYSLALENPVSLGGEMVLAVSPGKLSLTGVCHEGNSPRLISDNGQMLLMQNYPNPVTTGNTTVIYGIIENGEHSLVIYDTYGRIVHSRGLGIPPAGVYELGIDVSNLPTGGYIYCLKTPSKSIIKSMEVIK